MIITLLRHGIAIDRGHRRCPSDPERFLTEIGIAKTTRACLGLRALGIAPDAMISSPYVRARQTAEIAAEALDFTGELELDEALEWMKPVTEIATQLASRREDHVMLVGHAPHLDELVAFLTGSSRVFTSMKKSAAIVIDGAKPEGGDGVLLAHYPPRALRALAG